MDIVFRRRLTRPQPVDYGVVQGLTAALCGRHPLLRRTVIGSSVAGREIPALVLSVTREAEADPERVLMAAAFHGQEWLTALVALRLCEEICLTVQAGQSLCGLMPAEALRGRQVWVVPLVNPDGVGIARYGSTYAGERQEMVAALGADIPGLWQANLRGVDINHNFNAGWTEMQELYAKSEKRGPAARQWSGPLPESEPETRALTDLCRRYRFRHVVALHSQGEELYWEYGEHTPPQSRMMAQVMADASGYAVAQPVGMASYGGFKDWFIRCYHRPGFTMELGKGVNPLPVENFEEMYIKAREMLLLSLIL